MAAAVGQLSPSQLSLTLDRVFDDAQHTGIVDLSCRNLREYPQVSEDYDLADTVETNLSKNRFLELPKEICNYLSSEVLNCYHNCLRSIPEVILNLQQLTYLNLSRNQLTQLPSYICQLQSLEVLLIRSNKLAALPEQLGELRRLVQLDCSWNELEHVPSQLGDLKRLQSLDLSHNALADVPPELCKLKLLCLDLSSNRIQYIPLEYRTMDTLDRLALDNNPLVCPPAHICTKGRVHIIKYLQIVSLRDDRRKGSVATDGYMSRRESGRRSMHRIHDADEIGGRRAPGGMSTDSLFHCESLGIVGASANTPSAPGSRSPRHGPAARLQPVPGQQQLSYFSRDVSGVSSAGYAGASCTSSSSRLLPVTPTAASQYGSAASPTYLQFANEQQSYATPTPPSGTPVVDDVNNDGSVGELLRRKQEYELKKRRASATTAEEQREQQQQQQQAALGREGRSPASAAAGSIPRQSPCSGPAASGGLRHVHSSSSVASEASRADTVMSVDSLCGLPVSTTVQASANGRPTCAQRSASQSLTSAASSKQPVTDSRLRLNNGPQQQQSLLPNSAAWESSKDHRPQREAPAMASAGCMHGTYSDRLQRAPLAVGEPQDEAEALLTLKATLESRLNITLSQDLPNALRDGVVLCLLVNHVRPKSVAQIHMPTVAVPKLTMAQCRRNVDNFIQACKRLGVPEGDLCTVTDVLDNRLPLLVARTVESLCRRCARDCGSAMASSGAAVASSQPRPRSLRITAAVPAEPANDGTGAAASPAVVKAASAVSVSTAATAASGGPSHTPLPVARKARLDGSAGPASSAQGGRVRKMPQSPSAV